jgi:hypothetical protein
MDWKLAATSAVIAALVSGVFAILAARLNTSAGREKIISDKAWADYELRRDQYIRLAELIGCLFTGETAARLPEFHEVARAVRIVGSDEVVTALNALTEAIKTHLPSAELEKRYRDLFNAMRRDIREIHELPPQGTTLGPCAFPIEN